MTNFKRYFVYHLRSNLIRTLTSVAISFIYLFSIMFPHYREAGLYAPITIMGVLATLIPIFEFYQFKAKRNLDTLFSLPISRRKIAVCHYLCGLIEVCGVYTASFICLTVIKLLSTDLNMIYFIPCYFAVLGYGVLVYTFFTFAFNIGNTVLDGIMIQVLYIFAPSLALGAIRRIIYLFGYGDKMFLLDTLGFVYEPLGIASREFEYLSMNKQLSYHAAMGGEDIVCIVAWSVICISAFFAFLYLFERTKAEKAEDVSDSRFGYKVMIPVCGISLAIVTISSILTILLTAIGYIIYRRGFRFRRSDYIIFAIISVLSIICEFA